MLKIQNYRQTISINNRSNFKTYGNENTSFAQIPTETKVAVPTLLAYLQNIQTSGVDVSFSIPMQQIIKNYSTLGLSVVNDLNNRAGQSGQVLNWIGVLPNEQLNRLDEIYSLAQQARSNGSEKLGIIGIGGSKHTIENMLSLNKKTDNVLFLSSVEPDDMRKFVEDLGDLNKATVMVASKSGTTLEPSTGYDFVEKLFVQKFKNDFVSQGYIEEEALKMAKAETSKHFICITDKDHSKSKLGQIADEKGYKCGIIHDECGGRYGAFDDHTLTALAWQGMPKSEMKKMLEASLSAQKKFLSVDFSRNKALQRAIFNVESVMNGKTNQHDYYFGDVFEGTKLWNTQMKKESHKSLYKVTADLIGPEFLHNSTESDLDEGNKTSFYTFNKLRNNHSIDYKSYNALIDGSYKAYSERHPVSVIELKDLSPESIGEFVELKHFESIYTGMMLRSLLKGEASTEDEPLAEVVQPSVGIYKAEVKKLLNI